MAWEPDYLTKAEVKTELRIPDTDDDTKIDRKITAASRAIDRFTKRQFGQLAAVEARYYTPWYDEDLRRWAIEIDDLMDSTGMLVAIDSGDNDEYESTLTTSEVVLRSQNAASILRPWTQLVIKNTAATLPDRRSSSVRITAKWGWTAVPTTIKEAAMLQVSRLLMRKDSPYGVAGSPSEGSELRLLAKLDPDVEVMINTYRRTLRPS